MNISKLILVGASMISFNAFAEVPNMYSCVNKAKKVEILYSTTSLTGKPQLDVIRKGENLTSGSREEISVRLSKKQEPLGTMISATVQRKMISDAPALVYSVLLPGVELGEERSLDVDALALFGNSGGFRRAPTAYQFVNEVIPLKCKAQFVNF